MQRESDRQGHMYGKQREDVLPNFNALVNCKPDLQTLGPLGNSGETHENILVAFIINFPGVPGTYLEGDLAEHV